GYQLVLSSPRPATSSVKPWPSPTPPQTTNASVPTSAPTAPSADAPPVRQVLTDADSIREGQTLLKRLGYDPGPVDGTNGPLTRKAIHEYLWASGLPGTDEPTPAILARLRSANARYP